MLKASGMYRRSRRLCGQGRRRHEEGVVDIRESPLTEARRGGVVDGSPGYGGGGRARPLGVEVGAGVSSTGEKSAGRARRGITLEDEGDAELNGTADDDGVGGAGGGGAGGELGYGGGGGRARPVVVEGGAGISRALARRTPAVRGEAAHLTVATPCSTVQPTATALAAEALADRSATAEAAEHVRSESRLAQES